MNMGLRLEDDSKMESRERLAWLVVVLAFLGLAVVVAVDDDPALPAPAPVTPKVNIETDALLNAATIELRGYDESGKPGVFLYDCAYDEKQKRLVCDQREGK